jgi:methyl-accepting chemotaxis protein
MEGETMDTYLENRRDGMRFGLYALAAVAAAGFVLLALFELGWGGAWAITLFAGVGAAGMVGYYLQVVRPLDAVESFVRTTNAERHANQEALVEALEQLKSGDLVASSEVARRLPDRMRHALENAISALDHLAQQIQGSSLEVAASANRVNQIATELASGSSEQSASVVEITAAMEELARTASQIADNATVQAELAVKAEDSGNAGASAVEEAVAGVEEVRKRIAGIANRADTLGTRSKEIYRVLDLITEISQETHILSLNAAIEAAAAGEHGRRFSVVADEVRRLAQRSQESVDSVRNLLDEFASSIRATVVATEEGSKEAARVLERARAAASAIELLRAASGDTARVAKEISLATQQQTAASDEVLLTLKEVSQVVQRMADGLKQFTGTADRLDELALNIQLLAQSFHLDSDRSLKHRATGWAREASRHLRSYEALEGVLGRLLEELPFVEAAYVVDAGGNRLAWVVNRNLTGDRPTPASDTATDRPWFKSAVGERKVMVTPPYDSLLSRDPCFTVAVPLPVGAGRDTALEGVLGIDIHVKSWTRV